MSGLVAVYRREVAGLFLSPLAWTLLFLALGLDGLLLLRFLEGTGRVTDSLVVVLGAGGPFWVLSALLAPLVTMRMISEESRTGLLEFLLTAPVSDAAAVVAKALAATTFFAVLWSSVPLYGLCAALLGAPPDWGVVATAWLGAVLVGALFSSVGLVASAASGTPLVAAFVASVVNLGALWGGALASSAGRRSDALGWLLEKIDVLRVYQRSFQIGALDSAHVVWFLAWIAALLFVAVRLVEARRWL